MREVLIDISVNRDKLINKNVDELKRNGYKLKLRRESTCLYCLDWRQWIIPKEFKVDGSFYFQEASDPNADRVLYAISLLKGGKGLLMDTCNVYMDNISQEMLEKLWFTEFVIDTCPVMTM